MAAWLQYLIALGALLVLAPLLAWIGVRFGSRAKGGLMMACVLLGIGAVLDQPAKHAIEATDPAKGSPENGEPPLP
jgi:galactitol-specific phosphotransferase system IIC component